MQMSNRAADRSISPVQRSLLSILLLLALGAACPSTNTNGPSADPAARPKELGTVLISVPGRTLRVTAEVVRSSKEQTRGLMYRKQLGAYHGMLFIYPDDDEHTFWMKNTYIPLDMIFIDAAMKVVGSVQNAEPLTLTTRTVGQPSRYILEVNGGFVQRHGVKPGAAITFEGIAK